MDELIKDIATVIATHCEVSSDVKAMEIARQCAILAKAHFNRSNVGEGK